ncbi:unnamed protein product [Candidula unifasciata]|uniref:Tudor domain-containing protein n=1 Tax=Candidula unifasciata TaxID=100452 RepID=A0A8S3Z1P4_9EUPU|nr:unnamed protein product [Candidula unifasciata]
MLEELDDWEGGERLQDNNDSVNTGVGKTDPDTQPCHVEECVQDLTQTDNSVKPTPGKALYTWKTKPETSADAAASGSTPATTRAASATASVCDTCHLPKFWSYPLLKFVSLQVVRVENPSDFVAIPMEQRGALEKLELAIAQYFSMNKEAAATISDNLLYAVRFKGVYRRALYVSLVENVVKVFFPDHHCYDMVPPSQLLQLPQQFYSLPFLARRMRLGGIQPQGQDWPADVVHWFKTTVGNKTFGRCIPATLVVRLIDTSGSEDLVVDEYMESHGMAVSEPSSDLK